MERLRMMIGSRVGLARAGWRRWAARALLALALVFGGAGLAWAQALDKLEIVTSSGVHPFSVELANNDEQRETGLMYRRFMPADRGMLFDFQREAPVTFWMKNTLIPLDMIFISKAGIVTGVAANAEPMSERLIPSGGPCYAVLELNGGAAAAIGLRRGDKVRNSIFAP